jgi:hypothetical protein
MYAVFIRLADPDKLDELLTLLLELGMDDALVINGTSMSAVLERDVPLFAGLLSAFPHTHPTGELIVAVSPEREAIERLWKLAKEIGIDFKNPESARLIAWKAEDFS